MLIHAEKRMAAAAPLPASRRKDLDVAVHDADAVEVLNGAGNLLQRVP